MNRLDILNRDIIECQLCPRLRQHCENIAVIKRKAFRDQSYWGRPVPSFGDRKARVFILGLAPGAHGANRTGRVFTGDRSGDFLYRALFETGFASQPQSVSKDDGLVLNDAWISASVRCAPPDNQPTTEEVHTCRPYVERELDLLPNVQVVVPLGQLAFHVYLSILKDRGQIPSRAAFRFGHDVEHALEPKVITSYHPSQQNTSTGKLTAEMLRAVFEHARSIMR